MSSLLVVNLHAQNSKDINEGRTLLWKISGKGLPAPSYLYGTMHIVCAEDAKLSDSLKAVIAKTGEIFFEIDLDDMEQMMGMLKFARMNDGQKISDLLTPVEYQRVEGYFKEHPAPLPFAMMNRFKPYFVTAMIAEGMVKCDNKSSVEQLIMEQAKKGNKNLSGLETIEFQASLFDSIPYEKQAKDLVSYVDSIGTYRKSTTDMMTLYRNQDIQALDTLMAQADPGMSQYLGLLLYNRNLRWSYQIPQQAFEKSTLFAVGAGHLGGANGVINLLRKQGFTLTPMKN